MAHLGAPLAFDLGRLDRPYLRTQIEGVLARRRHTFTRPENSRKNKIRNAVADGTGSCNKELRSKMIQLQQVNNHANTE
jgi:hypothetical protein